MKTQGFLLKYPDGKSEIGTNGNQPTDSLVSTTYKDLKDKRDAGKLTPGSLYRITDYQCTTTQQNTQSAGHQFDIVLLALSENKLAEEGWAMRHENDTYFAKSNLSAWKVWYCLDNDTDRFAWADNSVDEDIPATITSGNVVYVRDTTKDDETKEFPYGWISDSFTWRYTRTTTPNVSDVISNSHDNPGRNPPRVQSYTPAHEGTGLPNGRGVIYRLIDEWGNDVPWDYKNILFTINDETTYSLSMAVQDPDDEFDATLNGGTLGVIVNTTQGESRDGRTPKSIYPISRVMLQQCLIYLNEDVSPDSYLFTNNGHANIIYGLEIYDPNA